MSVKKWLKYELLIKYGLSTEAEISAQIKRYKKTEIDKLYNDIGSHIDQRHRTESVFVIKLVSKELRFKLKNYRIYNRKNLDDFIEDVKSYNKFEEIWYCETKLDFDDGGVYGRLYINNGGKTEVSHCVEMVWADTARKLESILYNQEITYLRAKRLGWGWRYKIAEINCTKNKINKILYDFYGSVRQLENKKDEIVCFAEDLFEVGICTFDIEYKVVNGQVSIIDWDTPNDILVLERLL